jgi:hypothetical protein
MLAPVLPFRRRATPRDWTEQDKAEFYRVIDVLGRAGIPLELEMGQTDEDEPWAVFCTVDAGEPVVHIARLGPHYILAATTMAEPLRGPELRGLIRIALQDVPAVIMPGSGPGGLALHPAALLLVLVATCWFQAAHAAEPAPDIAAQLLGTAPDAEDADMPPADLLAGPEGEGQEPGGEVAALRFQHSLTVAVALLTVSGDAADLIPTAVDDPTADPSMPRADASAAPGTVQDIDEPATASRQAGDTQSVLATDFTPMLEDAPPASSPTVPVAQLAEDAPIPPMANASRAATTGAEAILPGVNGVLVWQGDGAQVQPVEAGVLPANWGATPAEAAGQAVSLPAGLEAAKASLVQALGHLDAYQSWSMVQTGRPVTLVADLSPELSEKLAALIVSDIGWKPGEAMPPVAAADPGAAPPLAQPPDSLRDASSLVSLVSLGGPGGAREQQVSLDAALAQLRHFTTNTPDHLTILSGKSLVLLDPAVLKGGQQHAYSSFTMSDGSELAWIYPVGVGAAPWSF